MRPFNGRLMERGEGIPRVLARLRADVSAPALGNSLVGALFSGMGPGLIVMSAAREGGLPDPLAGSWIFSVFFFAGLSTLLLSAYYRMPIVMAYSVPGAIMVGKFLADGGTPAAAAGTYIAVALAILLLTATGWIQQFIRLIPTPIMLGMVSGVYLSFGVNAFAGALSTPWVYGLMMLVYFLWTRWHRLASKVPAVVAALAAGVLLLIPSGMIQEAAVQWGVARPVLLSPVPDASALLSLGVPLFFVAVGGSTLQTVGVLIARGYAPPVAAIFSAPALVTLCNAFFGGHPAVVGAPSTSIVSTESSGRLEQRWTSAFSEGILLMLIGLLAKVVVEAARMVPETFMQVVAGLAMFDVLIDVFKGAFSARFQRGALVAFLTSATGVSFLGVSSAFWAIIFGLLVSALLEPGDFLQEKPAAAAQAEAAAGRDSG